MILVGGSTILSRLAVGGGNARAQVGSLDPHGVDVVVSCFVVVEPLGARGHAEADGL
jgi:hypothetical protein